MPVVSCSRNTCIYSLTWCIMIWMKLQFDMVYTHLPSHVILNDDGLFKTPSWLKTNVRWVWDDRMVGGFDDPQYVFIKGVDASDPSYT